MKIFSGSTGLGDRLLRKHRGEFADPRRFAGRCSTRGGRGADRKPWRPRAPSRVAWQSPSANRFQRVSPGGGQITWKIKIGVVGSSNRDTGRPEERDELQRPRVASTSSASDGPRL